MRKQGEHIMQPSLVALNIDTVLTSVSQHAIATYVARYGSVKFSKYILSLFVYTLSKSDSIQPSLNMLDFFEKLF